MLPQGGGLPQCFLRSQALEVPLHLSDARCSSGGQSWTAHLSRTCSVLRAPSEQPSASPCANTPGVCTHVHRVVLPVLVCSSVPHELRVARGLRLLDLCPQVQSGGPSEPGMHSALETCQGHQAVGWLHTWSSSQSMPLGGSPRPLPEETEAEGPGTCPQATSHPPSLGLNPGLCDQKPVCSITLQRKSVSLIDLLVH